MYWFLALFTLVTVEVIPAFYVLVESINAFPEAGVEKSKSGLKMNKRPTLFV